MSQIRVVIDGVYQWRDEGPSNGQARAHRPAGAIVQGDPGSAEVQRASQRRHAKALRTQAAARRQDEAAEAARGEA